LLLEIEELKKMADAKARALESEINMLRDEVKELRLLLSGEEDTADTSHKKENKQHTKPLCLRQTINFFYT
jgi:hypothetical protein